MGQLSAKPVQNSVTCNELHNCSWQLCELDLHQHPFLPVTYYFLYLGCVCGQRRLLAPFRGVCLQPTRTPLIKSCGNRHTLYKLCTHIPLRWARCHPSACGCLCQTPSTAADPASHGVSEGCRPHAVVIVYVQPYKTHERLRPLLSLL